MHDRDRYYTRVAGAARDVGMSLAGTMIGRQGVTARRLARDFPARMIKDRMHAYALAGGAMDGEAAQLREAVSGHSLRAGFITSVALGGTPEWKIRGHSRHKSADMVAKYVRAAAQMERQHHKGDRLLR